MTLSKANSNARYQAVTIHPGRGESFSKLTSNLSLQEKLAQGYLVDTGVRDTAWLEADHLEYEAPSDTPSLEDGEREIADYLLMAARKGLAKASKDLTATRKLIYQLGSDWAKYDLGDAWELPIVTLADTLAWNDNLYTLFDAGLQAGSKADLAPSDSPDQTINQRYLEGLTMPSTRVAIIQSPKNTGKTTWLKSHVPSERAVVVLGHRRTLLRNQANALGLDYYEDCKNRANVKRIAITLDSLTQLGGIV